MWIHRLQRGRSENRLTLPKELERRAGWRPGTFVLITVVSPTVLTVENLGDSPRTAGPNLRRALRSN